MATRKVSVPSAPALIPAPQFVDWHKGVARTVLLKARASRKIERAVGYELELGTKGATLSFKSAEARELGLRTLGQLERQAPLPSAVSVRDWPTLSMRGIHADMKYLAARHDWMMTWLEQLAAWKLNTIVLEYEDKFPFERVKDVAHSTAWTRGQVSAFVSRARELGIRVIPLVQTFGHLEYVLVHERYAGLREMPESYSQLCPSKPESFQLVTEMLGEVLELHREAGFVHIGCDETAFLGRCPECARRVEKVGKVGLYASFVARICDWVLARGVRPILWDDILRRDTDKVTILPKGSVLMYWNYGGTNERFDDAKQKIQSPDVAKIEHKAPKPKSGPPYAAYRQAGYDVIMAPLFTEGGLVPNVTGIPANCRQLSIEGAAHGCLGVTATSWSCLFTPFSASYHCLAALADAAWNPLPSSHERLVTRKPNVATDFDRRFCREFLGLPDDTLVHALRLMDVTAMFCPGGQVFPTYFSEPFFVDASVLIEGQEYGCLGSALFRPDWPTRARKYTTPAAWAAKVKAMRRHESSRWIASVVAGQLERCRTATDLIADLGSSVRRNRAYYDGLMIGAEAREWRLEHLLHELAGTPPARARPDLRRRLRGFYAASLSEEDATLFADWMLCGLPK